MWASAASIASTTLIYSRPSADGLATVLPLVEKIAKIAGVPGISVGIIELGKPAQTHHFGFRDITAKLPLNDHTRHNINSLTKGILSALVGIEIFKNSTQLDWQDPIRTWLPNFDGIAPEIGNRTNIIDLLSHRTGVAGNDDLWMGAENVVFMPRSEACRTFTTLTDTQPFRAGFEYNNWGAEIVGQVLEASSGQRIDDLMHNRIFQPLKMTRTSTSWDHSDDNEAKSYGVLQDLSPVEVARPQLGNGTLMGAAGGVKSTMHDMLTFYEAFLREVNLQYERETDETKWSPLKNCRMLTTNHARLPGLSLLEQGSGMGWIRAQLPGQLGRISANGPLGQEPVVGKGGPSTLVLYHHGCMPGSTTAINLVPERGLGVLVLQNSMPIIDTADLISQMILEKLLDVPRPNDYVRLARAFHETANGHQDVIIAELEQKQTRGTKAQEPLSLYAGRYWNEAESWFIEILEQRDGGLSMRMQGLASQGYNLTHYEYDTFSWIMPFDEVVRRARGVPFYSADYYLLHFGRSGSSGAFDQLQWAMNSGVCGKLATFKRIATKDIQRVYDCCLLIYAQN